MGMIIREPVESTPGVSTETAMPAAPYAPATAITTESPCPCEAHKKRVQNAIEETCNNRMRGSAIQNMYWGLMVIVAILFIIYLIRKIFS